MLDPMTKRTLAHWILRGSAAFFPFLWAFYKLVVTRPQ